MIDWGTVGPANSPTPSTPDTTVPVGPASSPPAPAAPVASGGSGNLLGIGVNPQLGDQTFKDQLGHGYHDLTQQQVDQLDPGQRIGRGIDFLGDFIFGEKSVIHDVPGTKLVADVVGAGGQALHAVGTATVVKPIEAAGGGLARIPLGWLPGGADEQFNAIGEWAKQNSPEIWAQWQAVNAAANGDVLMGGNFKADFNVEVAKMLDDTKYNSQFGSTPVELQMGRESIGSLGGAAGHAMSWLGLLGNNAQRFLGEKGLFDPGSSQYTYEQLKDAYDKGQAGQQALDQSSHVIGVGDEQKKAFEMLKAGTITEAEARSIVETANKGGRNRVEEAMSRQDLGLEVSDVEKKAIDAYRSGAWSIEHAQDYIVQHGQSITRNPVGQIVGGLVTDPLTYLTIGAGSIAKAGKVGQGILEAGNIGREASLAEKVAFAAQQESNYQKVATAVGAIQQSELGTAFRIARGLIDPFAVYKPSTVARAVTDLKNGAALTAFERAYGPTTVKDLRSLAREFELGPEMDSAIASYSIDQADLMIARQAQRDMLVEGLGEELVHSNVDDVIDPMVRNADRDAITKLTDHMLERAKNTFTAEERLDLAGRMATTFGNDVPYWEGRLAKMSDDLKSALHAVTYKRGEVAFAEALAKVDAGAYTGKLPLDNLVLMTSDTLDDVTAQRLIQTIREGLKGEEPAKIAMATQTWNELATKYPKLANMGYATGGKEQVEALVKELEKELERGGITRRALTEELNDPALRPIRDMLDKHSVPGAELTPEEQVARDAIRKADAERALADAGWTRVSHEKFFAAIKKAQSVTKSNGRSVGETVYRYPKGEYAKMDLWLSADGKAGFAIKPDGDLVSVFNGGDTKGVISGIVEHFNALGATKLDAFDETGRLPELYARGGFKEVKREAWNPQYAPDGWTGGTPDVVYMAHPGPTTEGYRPLWKVGFRPDEEVSWGLKRDVNTGRYVVDRDPTISHVMDAVPGRNKFSDTTRNVLGQTIGKAKAERLNKPIESIEAMANTLRDGITGRRLVLNMQRRFEKSMFGAGVPKPIAQEIWGKARDVAGLDYTTVRGIKPANLWEAVAENIPPNLVLKDGTHLNVHTVMDHLLTAAEGDLRIMGVTSVLSQRMRNGLRRAGIDPANWAGQMTVTMYNKLRYSQPIFLIQRITDAPYYSILYGVTPVGKGALNEANAATRIIEDNLGRTGLARDFSMDMPEYATRSNFTKGITSAMQEKGLLGNKLERILRTPDTIIANNMTNMLYARWGDIVKGALDNLATIAEKGDPALKAEMLAAGDTLTRSFAEWRAVYSEMAGRVLDDNEVGLRYVQDQLNAWRRHVVNADGTLDFSRLVAEGERAMPNSIGEIGPIKPDILAQELGYADAATLRRDIMGHVEKVNGVFQLVPGTKDLPWLEETLRTQLGAHPDYVRRASAYFGETWDDFWTRLAKGVDEGGLDISPHYAKEAQDLIAIEARNRGMDPWEYLSGVVSSNIGAKDLDTYMGQLMAFLKAGKAQQPIEEWSRIFRGTLDPSAQRTLIEEFRAATGAVDPAGVIRPAKFVLKTPKSAPGKAARPPVAELPDVFKAEPGYVYRVETPDAMEMGLPKGSGVTTGKPTAFYAGKDDVEKAIYRIKDDGSLAVGRHGAGGADRLTSQAYPPEQIEILAEDGSWHSLAADPADNYFETQFPELVRNRIASGVPHPNPEVEAYVQQFSKWVHDAIKDELAGQTRSDLRRLVEQVPHEGASPFNRSHALVVSLLKNKIEDAQSDIFRLAEMQTKRTVLERSMNHPLYGLYPASYMWGKVLPETVKFLAKNPYGMTYNILRVQRSIAIQREYDKEMDDKIGAVDRSAGAFLLDYLTPGLPWSDHSARMSPLVRDILNGKSPEQMWKDELATVSPDRWIRQVVQTMKEIPGAIDSLQPDVSQTTPGLPNLVSGGGAPSGPAQPNPDSISGPTPAAALAPILADDFARLQSILLSGQSPEE